MSTPILVNSGSVFNNANGSLTVTFPTSPTLTVNTSALTPNAQSNLVNITVLAGAGGSGANELKELLDVVGANSGSNGYVLVLDTHGTANTADDTFDFVPNNMDGGSF